MNETTDKTTPAPELANEVKPQAVDDNIRATIVEPNPFNIVIGKLLKLISKIDTYTDTFIKPEPKSTVDSIKEMMGLTTNKPDNNFEVLDQIIQENMPSLSPAYALTLATRECSSLNILSDMINAAKLSNDTVEKDIFHQKLLNHTLQVCNQIGTFENSTDPSSSNIEAAFYQMAILIAEYEGISVS
jgi:hypothetical protein